MDRYTPLLQVFFCLLIELESLLGPAIITPLQELALPLLLIKDNNYCKNLARDALAYKVNIIKTTSDRMPFLYYYYTIRNNAFRIIKT